MSLFLICRRKQTTISADIHFIQFSFCSHCLIAFSLGSILRDPTHDKTGAIERNNNFKKEMQRKKISSNIKRILKFH